MNIIGTFALVGSTTPASYETDEGVSWSSLRHSVGRFAMINGDGVVSQFSEDITRLAPEGFTLVELEESDETPPLGAVLENGLFVEPEVLPVPLSGISRRQFRKAILQEWGIKFDQLIATVQSLIADEAILEDTLIDIEDAIEFEWTNPRVFEIATLLGKDAIEVERVWRIAMKIE